MQRDIYNIVIYKNTELIYFLLKYWHYFVKHPRNLITGKDKYGRGLQRIRLEKLIFNSLINFKIKLCVLKAVMQCILTNILRLKFLLALLQCCTNMMHFLYKLIKYISSCFLITDYFPYWNNIDFCIKCYMRKLKFVKRITVSDKHTKPMESSFNKLKIGL